MKCPEIKVIFFILVRNCTEEEIKAVFLTDVFYLFNLSLCFVSLSFKKKSSMIQLAILCCNSEFTV